MTSDLDERIETLATWMYEARHLVVFTGAGISTESGLPDFRGPDGVWTRRAKGLPTERGDFSGAEPNEGHRAIAELLRLAKLGFLISQNIDNLHLKSGIPRELLAELHGNLATLRCTQCGRELDKVAAADRCSCGGTLVSSVVDFGQSLPAKDLADSFEHSQRADVFLVVGSSLVVTPAAEMPGVALRAGARLAIINDGETPYDRAAHLRFHERIGEVLPQAVERLKELVESS
jgi:mono-ADP-ribosyltransferase sirtuin 6